MDSPKPSASDSIIKILSGLTILALLVQGVLMLHWQVTTLTNQKRIKKPLKPAEIAKTPGKPTGRGPSKIGIAFEKYKNKPKPVAKSGGGGGHTEAFSKDGLLEIYRKNYNAKGIRDEEFITVMALDHADNAWSDAMVAAQKMLDDKNVDGARQAIKSALENLDERHFFARVRLLKMQSLIEFRAADPEQGRALQREADELTIELAKILIRGYSEKTGSNLEPAQAEDLIASLSDERDQKDLIAQVSMVFSAPGADPELAPKRITAIIQALINGPPGGGDEGGAAPDEEPPGKGM